MKRKGRKWLYCLSCILLAFLLCLHTSQAGNALQLTSGSVHSFTSGFINVFDMSAGTSADYNRKIYGSVSDPNLVFTGIPVINTVRQFHLSLSKSIAANSIFTFSVEYKIVGTTPQAPNYQYYGISSGSSWTLLDQSCITPAQNGYGGTANNSYYYESILQCTYVGFTNVTLDHISTQYNSDIITFRNQNTSASGNIDASMHFSPVNARVISWNALTQEDRAWLESVLPDSTSISDVQTGVENALETQAEEERQELENTQDDANESANNSSDEAESETQSLREGISSIINLVRDTPASDCNIRINYRIDTGVMNMCQMPDQFKTLIQTVTTIVGTIAVLNISYELLMLYVDSIRSFQDGGKEER